MSALRVLLEQGQKRVVASALDWPGWARVARDEDTALALLVSYAPRMAVVATGAGLELAEDLEAKVVERVRGGGS